MHENNNNHKTLLLNKYNVLVDILSTKSICIVEPRSTKITKSISCRADFVLHLASRKKLIYPTMPDTKTETLNQIAKTVVLIKLPSLNMKYISPVTDTDNK